MGVSERAGTQTRTPHCPRWPKGPLQGHMHSVYLRPEPPMVIFGPSGTRSPGGVQNRPFWGSRFETLEVKMATSRSTETPKSTNLGPILGPKIGHSEGLGQAGSPASTPNSPRWPKGPLQGHMHSVYLRPEQPRPSLHPSDWGLPEGSKMGHFGGPDPQIHDVQMATSRSTR